MTVIMRHDATGRSTGAMKTGKLGKIPSQFIAHTVEMRKSPAWRALSFDARKVLDRLELENSAHAGKENGRLPCTYDDFAQWGCRRASVADALRELEALGFIEIMQRGRAGNAEYRTPNLFRLTYVNGNLTPTDEWKRFSDAEKAENVATAARKRRSHIMEKQRERRVGKQNSRRTGASGLGHTGASTGQ